MYTTVNNLAGRITLTTDQTSYFNNVLDEAIDSIIDRIANTTFGKTAASDVYVNGSCSRMLVIPTMHDIAEITEINAYDGTETVVDSSYYTPYPQDSDDKYAIRFKSGGYWGRWKEGFENYKVNGVLGFKVVPPDVIFVATELAINMLSSRTVAGVTRERVGDWMIDYTDVIKNLSDESQMILNNYRRLSRSI